MKRFISLIVLVIAAQMSFGQGMEFFHGTWEEAVREAEAQNKMIFVDCYTTWCGPCKRMSAKTFPQPEVGDFYNANFINYKLDMEKEAGLRFKQTYPVSAYPTLYYISPDGEVVLMTKGAKQPADFISLGQLAVNKFDGSAKYAKLYEEGDHSYETTYGYINALNKSDKSSVKIANDYFREQSDLTTAENLDMLMIATTRIDSKIFTYFEENIDALVKEHGQEEVNNTIRMAAFNTSKKGVEYESQDLISEGHAAMKKYLPSEADEYKISSNMQYAMHTSDVELFAPNAKNYVKKYANDNPEELVAVSKDIVTYFIDDSDCLELGLKATKRAVQLERNDKTVIMYATLLTLNGDKAKAMELLEDAIEDPDLAQYKNKFTTARKQLEAA